MKKFHFGLGPFVKSKNKTNNIMIHLIISLIPIIIFSVYKNGYILYKYGKIDFIGIFYPLLFVLIGSLSTLIIEALYEYFFKKKRKEQLIDSIKNSYSFIPGLFLALILPINTPIYILIFGSLFATIFGKMLFGGFGNNIFNPALIGCLFIMSCYSVVISNNGGYLNSYEIDAVATATPLSQVVEGIGSYDTLVKPYGSLSNFFIGTVPGAVGETSFLLCLIAFIYLSLTKTIKWKIPFVYILTVFGITYMIGSFNELGIWYPLFQIMSGGLIFGAVFMATDPVTSPTTSIGQILYGLFLGILTVIFRYLTPYPEGVLTSILTMNMFIVILDKIGSKARLNFNKAITSFILAWVLIISLGFYIGKGYRVETTDKDPNFDITNKDIIGDTINYTVTQRGFGGLIEAVIKIKNNQIISIEVISQNESYYQMVIDNDYIGKIIKEQNEIENVDGISGATITSNALKKMVINTIKEYNGDINEK